MDETHGSRNSGPRSGAAHGLVPRGAVPSVKCSANRSDGEPCGRWAIVGGTVCPTHGGSAPQVREAARRRIEELVPLALAYQQRVLQDDEAPHAARARVSIDVLNRAGYAPESILVTIDETARPDLDAGIEAAMRRRSMAIDVDSTDVSHTEPHTPDA